MLKSFSAYLLVLLLLNCWHTMAMADPAAAKANEKAMVFEAQDGAQTDAFHGWFEVPENRNNPQSRTITLHYVRFPATGKPAGAPIIYLAGGPGGSGIATAKRQRFPLFMAMREFGDVIAFDQRGTGESDDMPQCEPDTEIPLAEPLTDIAYADLRRAITTECAKFWKDAGIDLGGYNTEQSAHDLDAVRRHLGAEKVSLWGISYGTHLALAALKQMDAKIERLILASAEGLDQTVKLPQRTDAYFQRLQTAVDTQPEAKTAYPNIHALIRRVHAALEAEPVPMKLTDADGKSIDFLLQRHSMQQLASGMIADPQAAAAMLQLYAAADHGIYQPTVNILQRYFSAGERLRLRAMPLAMDLASGIDDSRLAQVKQQSDTALIGSYLNFPMPHIRGVLPELELSDEFRQAPHSQVPTLLLSGTLDGRTYPEGQLEAVAGLANLQTVTVVNAGHNLFMTTPEVTAVIQQFMRGEQIRDSQIIIPLPDFSPSAAEPGA